jgi:hypothetical protein
MRMPSLALTLEIAALTAMLVVGASAQTEKIIHTFTGGSPGSVDGAFPWGGLAFDGKGNLYGTTRGAVVNTLGAVFELSPQTDGTWTENVIYTFPVTGQTGIPDGGLIFDAKGNLYGTIAASTNYGRGGVFELSPGTDGVWTEKLLYNFDAPGDGGRPYAGVAMD